MQITYGTSAREEVVETDRSGWGHVLVQAEPAVPRWPATLTPAQAQRHTGDACQPLMSMSCASSSC